MLMLHLLPDRYYFEGFIRINLYWLHEFSLLHLHFAYETTKAKRNQKKIKITQRVADGVRSQTQAVRLRSKAPNR